MNISRPYAVFIFFLLLFSAITGFIFSWTGLLYAFLLVLFSLLLLFYLVFRLFSTDRPDAAGKILLILWVMQVTGVVFNLVRPSPEAVLSHDRAATEQLEYMYNTNQVDRQSLKTHLIPRASEKVRERDSIRVSTVMRLMDKEKIQSPSEKYFAAQILFEGSKTKHYEVAYELIQEALEESPDMRGGKQLKERVYERLQESKRRNASES